MDDIKKLKQLEKRHTPYLMVSVPAFLFWLGWTMSVTLMIRTYGHVALSAIQAGVFEEWVVTIYLTVPCLIVAGFVMRGLWRLGRRVL